MITMGARGYSEDGSGGEIVIYWSESSPAPFLTLKPSRFSYWLINTFGGWLYKRSKFYKERNK